MFFQYQIFNSLTQYLGQIQTSIFPNKTTAILMRITYSYNEVNKNVKKMLSIFFQEVGPSIPVLKEFVAMSLSNSINPEALHSR